jgi:hypothetical protein
MTPSNWHRHSAKNVLHQFNHEAKQIYKAGKCTKQLIERFNMHVIKTRRRTFPPESSASMNICDRVSVNVCSDFARRKTNWNADGKPTLTVTIWEKAERTVTTKLPFASSVPTS